tara:strand:- start:85 stop:360 length:276 start_codon:yes stop_codon:yes gene_type:complete
MMNYFKQTNDAVLDGWVDYHAIQPTHLEVTDDKVLCCLDDLRQISIVGFENQTHVTITNTNNDDDIVTCEYSTIVAEESHLFGLKRFLRDY